MKSNNEILSLFPTPLYVAYINKVDDKFIKEVNKYKKELYVNTGNFGSKETNILEKTYFKNLKKEILKHVDNYVKNIISPIDDISFYITCSWLNWTNKNGNHHQHSHPNSIISGVYYINADIEKDRIQLFTPNKHGTIDFIPKDYNLFNSPMWWIPVETNKLVLFPSTLEHSVDTIKDDYTRISLAFNVFFKGKIGSMHRRTCLTI